MSLGAMCEYESTHVTVCALYMLFVDVACMQLLAQGRICAYVLTVG